MVRWKGYMAPCPVFPEEFYEYDIRTIGFGEAWKRLNHEMEMFAIPEDCCTCNLNEICHYCPPLHGTYAGEHLCNQEYCQYKHMLKDGR